MKFALVQKTVDLANLQRTAVAVIVTLIASLTTSVVQAIPIQQFCQLQGCLREWQVESFDAGAYRQDGSSNFPSQNYVVGAVAEQGGGATFSVFRDFFVFNIPGGIGFSADTRLIAQIQIRNGNDVGIQGSERYHVFDPTDLLAVGQQTPFLNRLVGGTGGIEAYILLGGDATLGGAVQSDFGFAFTGSNDFLSLGIVDLDLDAIARIIEGSVQVEGESRFAIGGRLEDFFGIPITGADGFEHYLFGGSGSAICPTCGATLVVAEIGRNVVFPIAEPSAAGLLGLGLAMVAFFAMRRRNSN